MLPIVEIVVDDPEGLEVALRGGAQRIELCTALALGALTPSPGLIAQAARMQAETGVPVVAMIRPRPGDFIYSPAEIDAMLTDIAAVEQAGLAGVAFGVTLPDGRPDADAMARLMLAARGLKTVWHRSFDLAPDPFAALELAVGLGMTRIMSSGGQAHAVDGRNRLAALTHASAGHIAIMAGGGVDADNAPALIAAGITELHASCRDTPPKGQRMGALSVGAARPRTSETQVRDLCRAARQAD